MKILKKLKTTLKTLLKTNKIDKAWLDKELKYIHYKIEKNRKKTFSLTQGYPDLISSIENLTETMELQSNTLKKIREGMAVNKECIQKMQSDIHQLDPEKILNRVKKRIIEMATIYKDELIKSEQRLTNLLEVYEAKIDLNSTNNPINLRFVTHEGRFDKLENQIKSNIDFPLETIKELHFRIQKLEAKK